MYGGSTLFITTRKGHVKSNEFIDNEGPDGAVKLYNKFDSFDSGNSKIIQSIELSQSNPYLPIISILSPLDALRLIHSIPNTEKFISKTIFIFDDVHMRTVETDVLIQDVYFSMMKAKKQEKKSIKMALMSTVPDDQFIRFLHPHQRMDVTNDVRKDVFKKELIAIHFLK